MPRIQVTQNDLLEALRKVLVKSGDGVTISDIVEAEGVSREQVRRSLVALSKQGRLEVTRVRRTDLAGRQTLVPAYKLKKAGK